MEAKILNEVPLARRPKWLSYITNPNVKITPSQILFRSPDLPKSQIPVFLRGQGQTFFWVQLCPNLKFPYLEELVEMEE